MKHHIALVTGASSGIGEALCFRLAREGLKLIISGRDQDRLTQLSQELPENCVLKIISADLLLPEGREQVIAAIHSYVPDLVINNAGFGLYGEALDHATIDEVAILEVNGKAVLELTLEAARTLREKRQQGVILNVSSFAAFMIFPTSAVYSASKAFVTSFSQSFDLEMEPYGIRILSSNPGMVKTEFSTRAGGENAPYDSPLVMNAASVADEMWEQIQALEPLRIIDWKYRILNLLTSFLPKRWIAKELQKNIKKRLKREQ
jgi:uncharacterized protein